MIFQEKKTRAGFNYKCEDVFGTFYLDSPTKLNAETLDLIAQYLIHQTANVKHVEGTLKPSADGPGVRYSFDKVPTWDEDNQEEPCESTNTSILGRVLGFIKKSLSRIRHVIIGWLWRYVGKPLQKSIQDSDRI